MEHAKPEGGMGKMRVANARKGQSTLEYILVITAILVAIVAVVSTTIKPATEQTLTDSGNAVKAAAGKLQSGLSLK